MRQSNKVALGGIIVGLSFAIMGLSFVDLGSYVFPAIAGVLLSILYIEIDGKTSIFGYLALSFLTILFIPNWDAKLTLFFFFGYYPILKLKLDTFKSKKIIVFIKIVVFNVSMVVSHLILFYLVGIKADTFVIFGVNLPIVFLLLGNVVLYFFERSLNGWFLFYNRIIRPKISKILK